MADTPKSYLLDLQPELLLEILRHLKATPAWPQDLCSWSSVSSHFRSFLGPYVFESITLRNTEKSGSSIALLATSNYRQHVRTLSFEGTAPGDEEDGFSDTDGILPEIVESLLADLDQFPQLKTVSVQFPMDFYDGWADGFMLFQETESHEERMKAEQEEAWRALNTKVYAALARNVNPGFKKLELQNLIPAEASSFSTPEFQNFLGQMTHFSLSCWIDDNSDYAENRRSGYLSYTQSFDNLFFNHLSSVTHLSISAKYLPVRLDGSRHTGPQLDHLRMPLLKRLSLDGVFIDSELKELLISHAHTLENIQLNDCHAWSTCEYNAISWSDLFSALSKENPAKLREFSLQFLEDIELFSKYHATQAERDEASLALRHLETHPERRLFAHSYLDDKYGFCGPVESSNLDSFRLGNDQRAYDSLMQIVERNNVES